jgi:hypothetical protein
MNGHKYKGSNYGRKNKSEESLIIEGPTLVETPVDDNNKMWFKAPADEECHK